ncbi:MAG TPA: carboxypeptidase-like regulatory domain-containing protein, partial [Planctomycetota bacterium]|nr:carboxypeptidase-like regulatory domain-containing protein [Planctomycetota bacterium]
QTGQALSVAADQHMGHGYMVLSKQGPNVEKHVPFRGPPLVTRFAQEELGLRVKCCVHGWMQARGAVFAHPFHAVTDDRGEAFLRLPPGAYEVSVWHEYDGFTKPAPKTVKVAENGTATIEFEFVSPPR